MADRYASLKQGLVGAWIPSISGSGLLLPDVSGRGNHGSLVGMDASDWVSGQYGRALDFDGSNQGVNIGNIKSPLQFDSSSKFTIALWLLTKGQLGAASFPGVFVQQASSNRLAWAIGVNKTTNAISFSLSKAGVSSNGFEVSATVNVWYHVAMIFDGLAITAYIDGKFANSTSFTLGALTPADGLLYIGRDSGDNNRGTNGTVDDCRIYNRALTESEIRLLASEPGIGFKPAKKLSRFSQRFTYKPPKPRTYGLIRNRDPDTSSLKQGLVGAWCPSLPNGGSGNTLPDQSGRGNNGVLTNMGPEDWVSGQYGRALDFDGVDDNVIANPSLVLKKTEGFSMTAWVYRNATNTKGTFFKSGSIASSSGYGLAVGAANNGDSNGDTLNLLLEGVAWVSTGATMSAQRWEHVAFVMQSSAPSITYLNGVEVKKDNQGVDATTATFYIGGYNIGFLGLNRHFSGRMDDIRIYNRALTESEIKLLASKRGIGLRQESHRNTFYQFPSGAKRRLLLTGQT